MSLFSSVSVQNLFILTHVFYLRINISVFGSSATLRRHEVVVRISIFSQKRWKYDEDKHLNRSAPRLTFTVTMCTVWNGSPLCLPRVWKKTRSPEETLAALAGGLPFKIYLERLDSHNNRALRAYEALFFVLLLYRRFSLALRSSVALSAPLSCVRYRF